MIRKDYIQRYFDEMAKVLAAMLTAKKNDDPIKAESLLDDFATDYLGVIFQEIIATENSLIPFLIEKRAFTLTHFKLLEDLMYHKYLINPSNTQLKKLTLEVLKYVTENDTDFSLDRMNRIADLDI